MDFLWGRNDRHQNQWYPFSIGDWGALVHSISFFGEILAKGKIKMKFLKMKLL
jgi:hypothetical protein